MARPALHSEDAILDAARELVARAGPRAVTIAAIAQASDAPTGSIYHRFRSVDELLARLWLRALSRSQDAVLAIDLDDPIASPVQAALALYDFCLANREDALLLGAFRRSDLEHAQLPEELRHELSAANEPIEAPLSRLVARLSGRRDDSAGLELALLAIVDLPFGFARRYLDGDATPPLGRREHLAVAVQALLNAETTA